MSKDNKSKPQAINVDQIDLEKMKEKTADLPSLLEYAHTVGGFSITPTKEGVIKGHALKVMGEQTQMQLDQIFEQMKLLAGQVKDIKDRAITSELIYKSEIKFRPVVGKHYYLFKRKDGTTFLSLIAPTEWGDLGDEKEFLNEVKLLSDHTWQVIKKEKSTS